MNAPYDYKKYAILYVDDEEKSLKYFKRAFNSTFRIYTAVNAKEGYDILQEKKEEIAILISDQRMPGEKGVHFLQKARALSPRIMRLLVTAYSDLETAIEAVNTGSIYKYLNKPWHPQELERTLRRTMEFFLVQVERDRLLRERIVTLENMMTTIRIVSMGVLTSGLNNQMRNALIAIKSFLDLAPQDAEEQVLPDETIDDPEELKERYDSIRSQVNQMAALLSGLSETFDDPQAEFTDTYVLSEKLQDFYQRYRERFTAKGISCEFDIAQNLPPIKVDEEKFDRLFELLLDAELAYADESDSFHLSAFLSSGEEEGETTDSIKIHIKNSARSVSEDFQLTTLDSPSSPLENFQKIQSVNLMACYLILYHHGGKMEVVSNKEGEVVHRLTIPINTNANRLPIDLFHKAFS